jgi:hypothetical protein
MTPDQAFKAIKEAVWGSHSPHLTSQDFPVGMTDLAVRRIYAAEQSKVWAARRAITRTDQSYWDDDKCVRYWDLISRMYEIAIERGGTLPNAEPPPGLGLDNKLASWVECLAK